MLFTQAGAATNRAGAWATGSNTISAFAGQSVRILMERADAATGSLVEAGGQGLREIECGLADVKITQTVGSHACPPWVKGRPPHKGEPPLPH